MLAEREGLDNTRPLLDRGFEPGLIHGCDRIYAVLFPELNVMFDDLLMATCIGKPIRIDRKT